MNKVITIAAVAILLVSLQVNAQAARSGNYPSEALLPNMQTVVPKHLQIQNSQQQEYLRFSNGIANTGEGNWQMIPVFPDDPSLTQDAKQELLDANGNVVYSQVVSSTQFHPGHNHWHMTDIAEFSVREGSPTGTIMGSSLKVTFCLIDWYDMDGNTKTKNRIYWDCAKGTQGIQPGWVDQYHQSLEGQELNITGLAPGEYYLVSTANYAGKYIESNYDDNTAWIKFTLSRDSNGNAKIVEGEHSDCTTGIDPKYQTAMCGEIPLNR